MNDCLSKKYLLGAPEEESVVDKVLNVVLTVFIVVLIAMIAVKRFWLQPVSIIGSSMERTLHSGDLVLMDVIAGPSYGDVVVIRIDENTNYIKRVIGLPGDTVYCDDAGNVHRVTDGKDAVIEEPYAYFAGGYGSGTYKNYSRDRFSVTLKSDEIFVMGDNRWNSRDSRVMATPLKTSSVMGVVHQWIIDGRYAFGWLYEYI